ncbi:MAG: choice-of-anchor Q domain-containing protein, partial [Planctomycetota bacterium]
PGSPVLTNCTVAANNASQRAGGLYCYAASNLATTGTILWQDAAQYGAELLVANIGTATSVSVSYCDVENMAASVIAESGCTVAWGEGNISLDPCLAQIASTLGGATTTAGDYHLLGDSPCVDAGNPAYASAPGELDIDGDARVSGGRIDIGADEREASVLDATLDAKPENLNLGSGIKRINCIVTLPEGYDVASIVLTTLRLNGDIQTAWSQIDPDTQQLMAKFERSEIEKLIGPDQDSVSLQLSGKLNDGTSFAGIDTIGISHANGNNGNGNGNGNGKAKGKR